MRLRPPRRWNRMGMRTISVLPSSRVFNALHHAAFLSSCRVEAARQGMPLLHCTRHRGAGHVASPTRPGTASGTARAPRRRPPVENALDDIGSEEREPQHAADVGAADPFRVRQLGQRAKSPLLQQPPPTVRSRQGFDQRVVVPRRWRPIITARWRHDHLPPAAPAPRYSHEHRNRAGRRGLSLISLMPPAAPRPHAAGAPPARSRSRRPAK
jgi:hypothetical protein